MQSLSTKICVNLRLPLFTEPEAGPRRRQSVSFRNRRGRNSRRSGAVIVACGGAGRNENDRGESGSSSSANSFLTRRNHNYAMLKRRMEVAAQSEDYEEAARIRDSMKRFEDDVPVLRLRRLLKEAIFDERFQDAARYRDELKQIAPHSLLKCSSDATTSGIRVQVRSVFIEGRSQPSEELYYYAYTIKITNNSNRPVQLLRRHWIVTDANGKTENIWGIGVVGLQPAIFPKSSFEYSSACPLSTQNGRMEGDFEMIHIDRGGSRVFNVAISPFSLSLLGDDDHGQTI